MKLSDEFAREPGPTSERLKRLMLKAVLDSLTPRQRKNYLEYISEKEKENKHE